MRALRVILIVLLIGALPLTYLYRQESQDQQQRITNLGRQLDRLQGELAEAARQKQADERRHSLLSEELLQARSRLRELDQLLAQTRAQVDPDYAQLEEQLRNRLEREYRQRLDVATALSSGPSPTAVSLISQMSELNNEERMALINVQGRYGVFLDSLQVSAERKEAVAQALLDLGLSQARAREDLASQQLGPQELARQMMALMSPEAIRDTLAYDLTDAELATFDEFQHQRQGFFITGSAGNGSAFMLRSEASDLPEIIQDGNNLFFETQDGSNQTRRVIIRSPLPTSAN